MELLPEKMMALLPDTLNDIPYFLFDFMMLPVIILYLEGPERDPPWQLIQSPFLFGLSLSVKLPLLEESISIPISLLIAVLFERILSSL